MLGAGSTKANRPAPMPPCRQTAVGPWAVVANSATPADRQHDERHETRPAFIQSPQREQGSLPTTFTR